MKNLLPVMKNLLPVLFVYFLFLVATRRKIPDKPKVERPGNIFTVSSTDVPKLRSIEIVQNKSQTPAKPITPMEQHPSLLPPDAPDMSEGQRQEPAPKGLTSPMNVMVCVLSRRSAYETRQVIRDTWASKHNNVFFAVGKCCPIPPGDRKKWTCTRSKSSSTKSQQEWNSNCAKEDLHIASESDKHGDIITMPDVDVYRHLPQKVKYCYKWGTQHTTANWFVKTDDDSVVRVNTLENYLQKTYDPHDYMVIGRIAKNWNVPRGGKWAELKHYKKIKYPNFPLGSVGHVVSRNVASYIVENSDRLFNYQGEDVSIGIWLKESHLHSQVKWVTSKHMTNHGNCKDTNMWVIGHNIKPSKMKSCFRHKDELVESTAKAESKVVIPTSLKNDEQTAIKLPFEQYFEEIFDDVHRALNSLDVKWWLVEGTLAGALRFGNNFGLTNKYMSFADRDIDIMVEVQDELHWTQIKRSLREHFMKNSHPTGWKWTKCSQHNHNIAVSRKFPKFKCETSAFFIVKGPGRDRELGDGRIHVDMHSYFVSAERNRVAMDKKCLSNPNLCKNRWPFQSWGGSAPYRGLIVNGDGHFSKIKYGQHTIGSVFDPIKIMTRWNGKEYASSQHHQQDGPHMPFNEYCLSGTLESPVLKPVKADKSPGNILSMCEMSFQLNREGFSSWYSAFSKGCVDEAKNAKRAVRESAILSKRERMCIEYSQRRCGAPIDMQCGSQEASHWPLTIVTAYIQLKSKHTKKEYQKWMRNTLSYQGPMVIFVDSKNIEMVKQLRSGLPTKLIETEIADLSTNQFRGKFNHHLGFYSKSKYIKSRNIDQDDYSILQCEKPNFLRKATKFFNTPYYMWLDIGYVRNDFQFPYNWPNQNTLFGLGDKIFVMSVGRHECKRTSPPYDYNNPPRGVLISGGVVVVNKNNVDKYHALFYDKLNELIRGKAEWAGMDQFVSSHVYCEHPTLFQHVQAKKHILMGNDEWFYGIPYFAAKHDAADIESTLVEAKPLPKLPPDKRHPTSERTSDVGKDTLVVVCHPDDESIWGASLLGEHAHVIMVTDANSKGKGAVRRTHLEHAMTIAKTSWEMWDWPETSNYRPANNNGWSSQKQEQLVQRLKGVFSLSTGFQHIITHNQWGEYGHIDHRNVHKAVLAAYDFVYKDGTENDRPSLEVFMPELNYNNMVDRLAHPPKRCAETPLRKKLLDSYEKDGSLTNAYLFRNLCFDIKVLKPSVDQPETEMSPETKTTVETEKPIETRNWLYGFEQDYQTTFSRDRYRRMDVYAQGKRQRSDDSLIVVVEHEFDKIWALHDEGADKIDESIHTWYQDVFYPMSLGSLYVFPVRSTRTIRFVERMVELQNAKMNKMSKIKFRFEIHGVACWESGGCAIERGMYDQTTKKCRTTFCSTAEAAAGSVIANSAFYKMAISAKRVTDKVSHPTQQYHYIYGKYVQGVPKERGPMLEIGLGCKMSYGAGASARLWAQVGFKDLHFIEYSEACVKAIAGVREIPSTSLDFAKRRNGNGPDTSSSQKHVASEYEYTSDGTKILVHVGDQQNAFLLQAVNDRAIWSSKNPNAVGFEFVVDDGGHENAQIITSFNAIWPEVVPGGFYVTEDMSGGSYGAYDSQTKMNKPGDEHASSMQYYARQMFRSLLQNKLGSYSANDKSLMECQYSICIFKKKKSNQEYFRNKVKQQGGVIAQALVPMEQTSKPKETDIFAQSSKPKDATTSESESKSRPDKKLIAEPPNVDAFWRKNTDRKFMMSFYPKLKQFKTVLDIGARGYTYRCKDLIGSSKVSYLQMEPYPPKKMNNDGLLQCTVQESLEKYPSYASFFDVIVDFGVLGWGAIKLTSSDIVEYIKNVRGLLKDEGMYVLKVDPSGEKRLDFSKYIEPYFEYQAFGGYKSAAKIGGKYGIFFLKKKKSKQDSALAKTEPPIDVVIPWSGEPQNDVSGVNRDDGILKFTIRSYIKYTPWVRIIFLFADPMRKPDWLAEFGSRVQLVNRCDHYIGGDSNCPTQNGLAVLLNLHTIPGLAERFIVSDDDLIITKPLTKDYFFKDGKITTTTSGGVQDIYSKNDITIDNGVEYVTPIHPVTARRQERVRLPKHPKMQWTTMHVPWPFLKSILIKMQSEYPEWFQFVSSHTTRFCFKDSEKAWLIKERGNVAGACWHEHPKPAMTWYAKYIANVFFNPLSHNKIPEKRIGYKDISGKYLIKKMLTSGYPSVNINDAALWKSEDLASLKTKVGYSRYMKRKQTLLSVLNEFLPAT